MKVRVKVRDLLPNPHRQFEYYPTDPKKIAALEAAIDRHEFWDGLAGRKSPTQPGKYEQGFGDARLKALRNRKGGDFEILLTVLPLTDKHMLQMMADENDPAYDDHRDHDRECVRATKAYLVANPTEWQRKKKANKDTGPSAMEIAAVLGWTEARVSHQLNILGPVERGEVPLDLVRPMSINTAEEYIPQARGKSRCRQEHLARAFRQRDKPPVSKGWSRAPGLHSAVQRAKTAVSLATDSLEHTYKTVLQVPSCLEEVELAAAEIDGGHHSVDELYIALCAARDAIDAATHFCESRLGRTPPPEPVDDPLAPEPSSQPPDDEEFRHMLGVEERSYT